ncbi:hypothetical protein RND81_04G007400 [Saponaria officinalis]|uniref:CCHC-type domain-containing protein n=1 Tax=Saponaria officinalis TaxID=3572 RepID=A0AAW1LI31_SAPOF
MSDSLFDVYQYVESTTELWNMLESKYIEEDASSKKFSIGNFMNYKMSNSRPERNKPDNKETKGSSSINIMGNGESSKKNKGKKRPFENTKNGPNKRPKGACWICEKFGHFKRDCRVGKGKKGTNANHFGQESKDQTPPTHQGQILDCGLNSVKNYVPLISKAFYVQDDDVAWWIDSGATKHVCKDRRWFKTCEPETDGAIIHMGNESTAPILGRGL